MAVEKCAVRSEDCLSHIKVVLMRRGLPAHEQGPDSSANGSEEKHHHHQRAAQSPRPSWLKHKNKQAHSLDELIFALWAALLEHFQAFRRLHYQEVLYNPKAPVDGKQFCRESCHLCCWYSAINHCLHILRDVPAQPPEGKKTRGMPVRAALLQIRI